MDLIRPLGLAGIGCAAVAGPDDPTRFSRFTRRVVERHDAWKAPGEQVEALLRFSRQERAAPILFYESDAELLLVSRHREALAERFRFALPERQLVEDLLDKSRFQALAARLDLPVPRARRVSPADEPVPEDLHPPLVIKPLTRRYTEWDPIGGGSKACGVQTREELRRLWSRLGAAGLDVLAQELVPGPETRIESYHVYVDADGAVTGEFTGAKVRTRPVRYGRSTALETTDAADVKRLGRAIAVRLGLRGVAKLDFKRAPDGSLRLLEVNPRFNLWHHLGAVAGVNLPAIVYADLAGLPRPRVRPARPGVRWSLPWEDLHGLRESGHSVLEWTRWTSGCRALSVAAWDDPMPFLRGRLTPWLRRRLPHGPFGT
jgi:D-aspartate ligase